MRQLIDGTIGYDPLHWHTDRTEPIKVMLNVAELIELSDLRPSLLGFDAASHTVSQKVRMELVGGRRRDSRIGVLLANLGQRCAEEHQRSAIAYTRPFARWRRRCNCRRSRSSWTSIRNHRGRKSAVVHNPEPSVNQSLTCGGYVPTPPSHHRTSTLGLRSRETGGKRPRPRLATRRTFDILPPVQPQIYYVYETAIAQRPSCSIIRLASRSGERHLDPAVYDGARS